MLAGVSALSVIPILSIALPSPSVLTENAVATEQHLELGFCPAGAILPHITLFWTFSTPDGNI